MFYFFRLSILDKCSCNINYTSCNISIMLSYYYLADLKFFGTAVGFDRTYNSNVKFTGIFILPFIVNKNVSQGILIVALISCIKKFFGLCIYQVITHCD